METTEKIVEAYVRHVKGWATVPNIRCGNQQEIDLLAIDPLTLERYHIEASVSGSQVYSHLTAKPFDPELLKVRVQKPKMRRTLGYFVSHKFGTPQIAAALSRYGFSPGNHKKIVVTWGWTKDAKIEADRIGIELWDFRALMREIAKSLQDTRSYFTDDTLRTINLFVRALADIETESKRTMNTGRAAVQKNDYDASVPFWVYRNWIHQRARLHHANCGYCNNGAGAQGAEGNATGDWTPFTEIEAAQKFMIDTNYANAKQCGVCM